MWIYLLFLPSLAFMLLVSYQLLQKYIREQKEMSMYEDN